MFPRDGGDVLKAEIEAAARVGLRFHPTRGSMDLGQSKGGLPPDNVVEDIDAILAATEAAIDTHHDPSFGSMLRIGVAPCSPFSVTGDLLRQTAELSRRKGVRMHTHLCETLDEEDYCQQHFGCTPVEYMESVGWLGPEVWLAHSVWLTDESIASLARTGTSVAHCPTSNARLGSGIARSPGPAGRRGGGRARRGRRRVQRGLRAAGGGPARPAVRQRQGRPAGADRP